MKLSIWPYPQQPWSEILEVVRHAEKTGWDGIYISDHFMGDGLGFGAVTAPTLESTAALSALAAATERLTIGSLVFGNTYRHPAVLANWAATVDQISNGRLVLGVGAGWQQNEHEQYGIDLPAPGVRLERFDEACEVIRSLLTESTSNFEGRHYQLTGAVCEPKPVQDRVPLLIGGKGDKMMKIVARHADQWNMWGLPDVIAERSAVLDRRCEEIGRDPESIHRSTQALVMVTDDPSRAEEFLAGTGGRAAVAGPPERFAEVVEQWREVGIDEVIVPDMTLGDGDARLAQLDALREVTRS